MKRVFLLLMLLFTVMNVFAQSTEPGKGTSSRIIDLQAIDLTGIFIPMEGLPQEYNVSIINNGVAVTGEYVIKLFVHNQEVASSAGIALETQEQAVIPLTWVPEAYGQFSIFAQVLHPADVNLPNNSTPTYTVSVQPSPGEVNFQVGDGDQIAQIPYMVGSRTSLFETIYYPQDLPFAGLISGLSFSYDFQTQMLNVPLKVWLTNTEEVNLVRDWIPADEMTLCFDGSVSFDAYSGHVNILLDNPFFYGGGNLVLLVFHAYQAFQPGTSNNAFRAQTQLQLRSRKIGNNDELDPFNPPLTGSNLSGQFPQTFFHVNSMSNEAQVNLYPGIPNWGDVPVMQYKDMHLRLSNIGRTDLCISSTTLGGANYFLLMWNGDPLPVLEPFAVEDFIIRYRPRGAGTHVATLQILVGENLVEHNYMIQGTGIDTRIQELPYSEDVETVQCPDLPYGWQANNTATESSFGVSTIDTQSHSPSQCIQISTKFPTNNFIYLLAPPLRHFLSIAQTRLHFWINMPLTQQVSVVVGAMDHPEETAGFEQIYIVPNQLGWNYFSIPLGSYQGEFKYIAFRIATQNLNLNFLFDDIEIIENPACDLAVNSISGYHLAEENIQAQHEVELTNLGSQSQTNYLVQVISDAVVLGEVSGTPVEPGETITYSVPWTPAQTGLLQLQGRVVSALDPETFNNDSANEQVYVLPSDLEYETAGNGDELARYPIDVYWRSSLSESIYLDAELPFTGWIDSLTFYSDWINSVPIEMQVLMGGTYLNHLEDSWVALSPADELYYGTHNFESDLQPVTIAFDAPFAYGGGNLILMTNRIRDLSLWIANEKFYAQNGNINRTRKACSDVYVFDPEIPPQPTVEQLSACFPQVTFHYRSGDFASGSFCGRVLSESSQALHGAQ
ncbi:MAG: hypothetical protein PHI68_00750, partial [Candidatus Cloacimonetes bacterium]|nr:hypothetical protein [Candidatus Cloacimonadota bacterium]